MIIRKLALGAASAALMVSVAPAGAQPFPYSFSREAILKWLAAETKISAQDVVSVGPTDIIAMRSVSPSASGEAGILRVEFQAEVVSARLAEAEGYRSWMGVMDVRCDKPLVRVVAVKNFPQRGLKGAAQLAPITDAWVEPQMGSQLYSLARAGCDKSFVRPFADVASTPAATDAAQAASAKVAPKTDSRAVVQVVAAPSEAVARQEMQRIKSRFAAALDLTEEIERVDQKGKSFFRARLGGFATVEAAEDFCRSLKAGSQDCFVRIEGP